MQLHPTGLMATTIIGKEAKISSRQAFLCIFSGRFIIFPMWCTTTCSEHQQFARAVFIFRLVFLQNLPVQPRKQKHPFSQTPFHRYIMEISKPQRALKPSFHPLSQCLRGLSLQSLLCVLFKFWSRHPGPGISALGFFARHLQSAFLWVLESLLLYKGGSHQQGKAQRFAAATKREKKKK